MENIIWVVLLCAVLALLFAAWKTSAVSKADAGTERMKEIAGNISDGARAFLFAEYKILVIFVAVLFVLIGLFITWLTAGCFLIGAVFSVCAGYVGMNVATKANVRTAAAAKSSGMNKALGVAFSGGSVMGMCVVGLGLLGCAAIYAFTGNVEILTGFSLGASSIALFARVGGGIYTKAADVGAALVGKVEAGIPEDDPRNPAVIADNVGDNVGDVAGMGADLFESYVGALVSALTLGVAVVGTFNGAGALFPLILAAAGIVASIIGCFFVRGDENSNPHKALKMGSYVASAIVVVLSLVLSNVFFGSMSQAIAIIAGLAANMEALSPRHAKRIGKFAGHPLSRRVNQVSAFVNRKESQGAVLRHQLILCRLKQLHECLLCRRGVESYGPIHYSQEIPLLFQRDGELLVHLRRNFRQLILAFAVEFFSRIAGEKAHPKENERK